MNKDIEIDKLTKAMLKQSKDQEQADYKKYQQNLMRECINEAREMIKKDSAWGFSTEPEINIIVMQIAHDLFDKRCCPAFYWNSRNKIEKVIK